jgi:hypothetical protein
MTAELRAPDVIDRAELALSKLPQVQCPLRHWFPDGMYVREITMPAGTIVTSRRHKLEHPFSISRGTVSVISDSERVTYSAPYSGITPAGTRRMLLTHTDTVWTTTHLNPTNEKDPDKLVEMLTDFDNPLADDAAIFDAWRTNKRISPPEEL